MSDLYQHFPVKFADAGIQLRTPVDSVPPNQYSQLQNAVPIIEGRLETRGSLKWIAKVANTTTPGSGCHSLDRLNQSAIAVVGDRIAGIDTTVQTFPLPAGNAAVLRDSNRTGDPLSLTDYHFNADSASWEIITDRQSMTKYRGGVGAGYYGALGCYQPQNPVVSVAVGGAGNPNNTGGPAYDWVYTHVFTPTQSESNPCFPSFNGNEDVTPTTVITPDPGFGGTFANASSPTTVTAVASSATESRQSALWSPWAVAVSQPYSQLYLDIAGSFVVTGTTGCVYGAIYFSTDGGLTWRLYIECSSGTVNFGIPNSNSFGTILLNPGQDLALLQVRAVVMGCGNTSASQNVIARRIRDRAGNFNITDLLVGANATNRQITLTINTIHTHGVQLGASVAQLGLTNQSANICIIDPRTLVPAFPVDAVRLYRRGGSITASWAFVQQYALAALVQGPCGANNLQLNDNVADGNLDNFVSFTNDAPVTSVFVLQRPLPYIWGPGFDPSLLFGCGDPDRPDAVYFTNPGNADQWGIGQWIDVSSPSDPMQNGCVYNTNVYAFSKERMFQIVINALGGGGLTPFQTPCQRGLISPWGLVATARAIFFVAKDGVYVTLGGQETSLVEDSIKPIFPTLDQPGRQITFATGATVDAVDMERVEDIRLRFHNDELWFIYRGKNTGLIQTLIFDTMKKRWRSASFSDTKIINVLSEEGTQSSLLLGSAAGDIYTTQTGSADAGSGGSGTVAIAVQVQTGAYDMGIALTHKEWGGVIFDIDPGGATLANPITITPLINGEAVTEAALTITGSGRNQFPMDFTSGGLPFDIIGYNIEFFITWNVTGASAIAPVLYQFDILWRPEPTPLVHWEARETSHGLPGWQHIRDLYPCIRSTADVVLTMTYDNNYTQTYTIPSTGGKRAKPYIPFHSNKFKLVRYSFDTATAGVPFKLYIEDSEARIKPWLTDLGYAVLRPFGAEATLTTAAFESKLLEGR